jgi:enamine deaminase RidA (YjgF/YER057c/UK114 family)
LKQRDAGISRGALIEHAGRAGEYVFTGSQTPHDPDTGALITSLSEIPDEVRKNLETGMLFIDAQSDRIRAQCWRALQNLSTALESANSALSRIVYLRVFLRDITDEPTVRSVLVKLLGTDLSAGEIVGATNAGASDEIDVQFDAIALSSDGKAERRNIPVPSLAPFTAPFAPATQAGILLFTSMIAGLDVRTGNLVERIDQLESDDALLARQGGPYTRRVETFVAQHFAMWRNFRSVLKAAGLTTSDILYYKTWLRRSMREVSHAYLTDVFAKIAGGLFCFTRFPVAELRWPGGLVEGRVVALMAQSGIRRLIKVPPHGISKFYIGAIEAGPLVITAGEVPIDTAAGRVVEKATDLKDDMRRLAYGRVHREPPIMAQADYVYGLLEKALAAHGICFEDVVHQSIYLADAADFPALERMACLRYGQRLPATSIVPIVGASPFTATRVEIEVTAAVRSAS